MASSLPSTREASRNRSSRSRSRSAVRWPCRTANPRITASVDSKRQDVDVERVRPPGVDGQHAVGPAAMADQHGRDRAEAVGDKDGRFVPALAEVGDQHRAVRRLEHFGRMPDCWGDQVADRRGGLPAKGSACGGEAVAEGPFEDKGSVSAGGLGGHASGPGEKLVELVALPDVAPQPGYGLDERIRGWGPHPALLCRARGYETLYFPPMPAVALPTERPASPCARSRRSLRRRHRGRAHLLFAARDRPTR